MTRPSSLPKQSKKRVLLDVTIAATTDLNTGIQRVVRNISRESESVSKELGIECIPVVCSGGHLSRVRFDGRPRLDERILNGIARGWMGFHKKIAGWLSQARPGIGEGYLKFLSRLRKLFVPKTVVRGISNAYRKLTRQSVQLGPNDTLVLLDASWDLPLDSLLNSAKAVDAKVVTVVYDLIPILYPNFHEEPLRMVFAEWLKKTIRHSDYMIGISQTVRNDLIQYANRLAEQPVDENRFGSFRLGADFSNPSSPESSTGPNRKIRAIVEAASKSKFFLTVGTIEPRKNHTFLLDAFDQVWSEHPDACLVVAGKVGWMCDDVADRIQNHPQKGKSLFFFDDATDDEIDWLYQKAESLIFPSIVEGFGLPIVEAFQHGTPVLASDTPIHREVAGDEAIFFDLAQVSELAALVGEVIENNISLITPNAKVTQWNQSCTEFLTKILDALGQENSGQSGERQPGRAA